MLDGISTVPLAHRWSVLGRTQLQLPVPDGSAAYASFPSGDDRRYPNSQPPRWNGVVRVRVTITITPITQFTMSTDQLDPSDVRCGVETLH